MPIPHVASLRSSSGLAKCGVCGGSISVANSKDGKRIIKVYGCTRHRNGGNVACPNTLRRPVKVLGAAVIDWIQANLLREEQVAEVLREVRRRLSQRMETVQFDVPMLEARISQLKGDLRKLGDALLTSDQKPKTVSDMIATREHELALVQARLASTQTAPQVLDLEVRRMEREARRRIAELRTVMGRHPTEARRALPALLDGKLTLTPMEEHRYEITGKISTGVLFHQTERPQREPLSYKHFGTT